MNELLAAYLSDLWVLALWLAIVLAFVLTWFPWLPRDVPQQLPRSLARADRPRDESESDNHAAVDRPDAVFVHHFRGTDEGLRYVGSGDLRVVRSQGRSKSVTTVH